MNEIRETRLPGVGTKFTMDTRRGESVCAVVHTDGLRESTILVVTDPIGPERREAITKGLQDSLADVREALVSLGLTPAEASEALASVQIDDREVEDLLREALQKAGR